MPVMQAARVRGPEVRPSMLRRFPGFRSPPRGNFLRQSRDATAKRRLGCFGFSLGRGLVITDPLLPVRACDLGHRSPGKGRGVVLPGGNRFHVLAVCLSRSHSVPFVARGPCIFTRAHSPFSFLPLSLKMKFARLKPLVRLRPQIFPRADIPDHHGACAVIARGNRPLETGVIVGMILDHHREPLGLFVGRQAFGYGPGF